ncbi:hypothetical protein PC121_g20682 [Phytophthora cactorum]|nr:hypothetical protein PC121_g20682 [Phytophthora cactorum]
MELTVREVAGALITRRGDAPGTRLGGDDGKHVGFEWNALCLMRFEKFVVSVRLDSMLDLLQDRHGRWTLVDLRKSVYMDSTEPSQSKTRDPTCPSYHLRYVGCDRGLLQKIPMSSR